MDQGILCFFEKKPGALPLYEVFERKVFAEVGDVDVKVQKTQIAFANKLDAGKAKGYQFAFVSFAPVRKAKERPKDYITVTFGLENRMESPRIDVAVEPYPNRWTHHVLVASEEEIDGELMGWVKAASEFSKGKK